MTNADTNEPSHYIELAKFARDETSWDRCCEHWQACFNLFPEQAQPFWYSHYGSALLKLDHSQKARLAFEECIQRFPDSVNGYIGLARTANHDHQWKEALAHWEVCFNRFPAEVEPSWHKQKQNALSRLGGIYPATSQQDRSIQQSHKTPGTATDSQTDRAGDNDTQVLRFQHILIVTYGRSGSTLLQGVLNGIEGVLLRGENENIFYDLYRSYKKLINLKNKYTKAVDPSRAWYGICLIDQKELLSQYQNLAKTILLADQHTEVANPTYGFKEIRYNEVGEDLDDYLDFLSVLFPNVAFIFNTRNLENVAASGWWKEKDRASVIQNLASVENRFSAYAAGKDYCFSITYEEVIACGEKLHALFDFLGAQYHPGIVEGILDTPHSYDPEQEHIKKMFQRNNT